MGKVPALKFSKKFTQPIVFALLLSFTTAISFHALAIVPGEMNNEQYMPDGCQKPILTDSSGNPMLGSDGKPKENPAMGTICGTVVSSQYAKDTCGRISANVPIKGVTIGLFELNPLFPTGAPSGYLTNLFSSSVTNAEGEWQLNYRKVGPPNRWIKIVYYCNGAEVDHDEYGSYHSLWGLIKQIKCDTPNPDETPPYIEPQLKAKIMDTAKITGCTNDPYIDTQVGLKKAEYPTVNGIVKEENYDHRYATTTFSVDLSLTVGGAGGNLLGSFQGPGGLWEPDCLLRFGKYTCNVTFCNWDNNQEQFTGDFNSALQVPHNKAWSGYTTSTSTSVCGQGPNGMAIEDRLTRPFYVFIPKTRVESPFRAFNLRADVNEISTDPLGAMQWTAKFFGSTAQSASQNPNVQLRQYKQPEIEPGINLMSCSDLLQRNAIASREKHPNVSWQINGGPIASLQNRVSGVEDFYYTQSTRYYDYVCQQPDGEKIRLGEVQAPWPPVSLCNMNESNANCIDERLDARLTELGLTPLTLKLSSRYFSVDLIWDAGNTWMPLSTEVPNDSPIKNTNRANTFKLDNSEGDNPYGSLIKSNFENGGEYKPNSFDTIINITQNQDLTDDPKKQGIGEIFTYPHADTKKEYYDNIAWDAGNYGGLPVATCAISDAYPMVVTSATENDPNFQPNNLFSGNNDHITSKPAASSTWYMSAAAEQREKILRSRGLFNYNTFVQGALAEAFYRTYYGRDLWDSILTVMGGDAKLHNLTFSLGDLNLAYSNTSLFTANADRKTYLDRDPSLDANGLIIRDVAPYQVEHAVSEDTFLAMFPLPTKSQVLNPGAWGGSGCYGWHSVGSDEVCATLREDPWGISRTCRLDSCREYERVQEATCTCTSPDPLDCALSPKSEKLNTYQCTEQEGVDGAYAQTSTAFSNGMPKELWDNPDWIRGSLSCTPDLFFWGDWVYGVDGPQYTDLSHTSDIVVGYQMSVAGPNTCTSNLAINDLAIEGDQLGTTTIGGTVAIEPQVETDPALDVATKIQMAWRWPNTPGVVNRKKYLVSSNYSNDPGSEPGLYTKAQSMDGMGGGDTSLVSNQFTIPRTCKSPNAPLEPMYYNCDMLGTYVPPINSREVVKVITTSDPDMGLYQRDTDGDGVADAPKPGWDCPIIPPPLEGDTAMSQKLPDYTLASLNKVYAQSSGVYQPEMLELPEEPGACGMTQEQVYQCGESVAEIPDRMSNTVRKMVNWAANYADVPAAALYAIIWEESRFQGSEEALQDEVLSQRWGLNWYGKITGGQNATCNELVWTSQGPMQIIQSSFRLFLNTSDPDKSLFRALNKLSPGRGYSASRCNLLDSLVYLALHLKAGGTCSNFNMAAALASYSGGTAGGAAGQTTAVYNACHQ